MPPYEDITQTGPQNWRTLQAQNNINPYKSDDYWNLSRKERLAFNLARTQQIPAKEILTEQQVPQGFGESRFDVNVPDYALDNLQDWRAQSQSGLEQIANGILKGAITTGTTYIDLLAGIPVGIITAVAEGRLSGLWDNVITNAMQSVTDWSEEALPNYYTQEQQESAWYSPVNLFSANFLGDKLIKNFGFSAGAGLGMKTISKIPKLLPKLAKNQNLARAINTAETSFAGAVGEGSIEALNGTREWANQNRNLIEQERSQSMAALDLKYSQLEQSLKEQYGNTEIGQQLMMSLMSDYQKEAAQINNFANRKVAELQNHIDDQGNLILAGNIPILWGSNILTLGKMIGRGYTNTQSSLGFNPARYVEKVIEDGKIAFKSTLTNPKQALRYAKTPFFEGLEEMNQAVISTAAKNRAQDYYNMAVDPDATEATKSYMGYLWDALGQTYGDINNYEEFVIGMLSSGISDIVVGQGKALRDERRQVNDAVNRANDAVNSFNNRVLLQNMNRQQVLEDQKLDAALRNDKKEYKDSEFGQIASAVIAFSQIGKIEDLKAMLDTNLTGMTDEELDTLADELSQKDENGAETNAFTLMSNEQRRDYLRKQKAAYDKTINDYDKLRSDLIEQTGSLFTPDQQAELIFYRLRANNANDRIQEIDKEVNDKILNDTTWTPQILKKLGLDEDIVYTKQEVANAIENFNGTNKQLANLFKGQPIEQLFLDKDRLEADIEKYNNTVKDFILNPQKLEQKNSKIRNKVNSIITDRKVQRIVPQFAGINTFSEFTRTLQNVDPKLQKAVLDELIKQGNQEAKSFSDKTTYARYVAETLNNVEADDYIKDRAAQLILNAIDKQTLNATKDLDNPLYSRESNSDLSDAEYTELYNVLANTLGKATEEVNSTITEEAPIKSKEEKKDEVSDEEFFADFLRKADEAQEEQANTETETKPKDEKLVDVNEVTPNTIVQENTTVLMPTAVGANDANLHDTKPTEDNQDLGKKPVSTENPLEELTRMGMGIKEVETKVNTKDYGKPITEQTDTDGNKTQVAKDLTPIYNRLKELNAFENVDNGAVKAGSIITFALDTTMKGDHTVDGETITYDEPAVLLYVGDKCVGSLTKHDAIQIGILDKLKEEFKGKSNDNPMISQKYYTTVETMEHGIVKFTNDWHKLTRTELDSIKERMANSTTSKDEVVPIIAIYDANKGAFVRGTKEEYQIGKQIGPTFYGKFYKGRAALLIPTAAYNNQSDAQPNKAFFPVGLNRIKAKNLSQDSTTVNIDKNRLVDKNYIEQLIDEGVLGTNVEDMRVIGNNFTMTPQVFEHQIETENKPKEETIKENITEQPTTKFEIPDVEDDDLGRFRLESLRTTTETINIDKEVDNIMKMLPQLDRNKVFKTIDTFIKVNDKGTLAMGQFNRGIITLSNIAESGTAYHEAFHLVFNMVLSNEERTNLLNEYKAKYPNNTPLQLEEQMAEDFRDFCMTRETRSLGQKIVDYFKDLWNIIKTYTGYKATFDNVASKIWRSKYSNRQLNDTDALRNSQEEYEVYETYSGATIRLYGKEYSVEDLSIERFQKLTDNLVNNLTYQGNNKSVQKNNQWGLLIDRWKSLGVNIIGTKNNKGDYIVKDVTFDYNNPIIRNIEQYKQNRNVSIADEKSKICGYTK